MTSTYILVTDATKKLETSVLAIQIEFSNLSSIV